MIDKSIRRPTWMISNANSGIDRAQCMIFSFGSEKYFSICKTEKSKWGRNDWKFLLKYVAVCVNRRWEKYRRWNFLFFSFLFFSLLNISQWWRPVQGEKTSENSSRNEGISFDRREKKSARRDFGKCVPLLISSFIPVSGPINQLEREGQQLWLLTNVNMKADPDMNYLQWDAFVFSVVQ